MQRWLAGLVLLAGCASAAEQTASSDEAVGSTCEPSTAVCPSGLFAWASCPGARPASMCPAQASDGSWCCWNVCSPVAEAASSACGGDDRYLCQHAMDPVTVGALCRVAASSAGSAEVCCSR